MKKSFVTEYKKLQQRFKKLISDGKQLQKEHKQNLEYFIDNHISDKEWENYLEKTTCSLTSASVTMKITEEKMKQIKKILTDKGDKK